MFNEISNNQDDAINWCIRSLPMNLHFYVSL